MAITLPSCRRVQQFLGPTIGLILKRPARLTWCTPSMCCGRVGHRNTLSRIEAFFDFKKADNWHLNIGQIPPAAGFPTLHVVLARRRLSVMVLRNSHPDATWFSAACR